MISPIKDTLNVRVINNTALPQKVNILGGTQDPLGVPPHRIYQWDLSGETYFGSVTATIVISNTSNPTPIINTVQVNGYNIQSVVTALNTLNQGLFQYDGNIVYVSSDYYVYGLLEIVSSIFSSTWNTSNTTIGSSASNQISLPLESLGTYNFTVNWGDGSQDNITSWNQAEVTHTYAVSGIYTLSITGAITGFVFNSTGDRDKLISVSSWGILKLGNSNNYFSGCSNLDLSSTTDILDLSGTTNMDFMFAFCTSITTINNINLWNIGGVTTMVDTFTGSTSFNDDISAWDVSSVVNMNSMFSGATSFNQSIDSWNVSSVTIFTSMFSGATAFNKPLNSWNVANATQMDNMFSLAINFNQALSSWDVSNVQDMGSMFFSANAFNQNINSWNVSNVTDFSNMFRSATVFNQPLNSWNVSNIVDMSLMFQSASSFNQPLNSWNVSNVTNMSAMFRSATAFNQNIGSWNTSSVSNFTNFMLGKTNLNYSTTNLDAIYNGWSLLTVQPSIVISFGTIKYTLAGQAGKNILAGAPNNWVISDGGI